MAGAIKERTRGKLSCIMKLKKNSIIHSEPLRHHERVTVVKKKLE
jgi:hypothetical protein